MLVLLFISVHYRNRTSLFMHKCLPGVKVIMRGQVQCFQHLNGLVSINALTKKVCINS